jgi:hypothetical protein
LEAFGVAAGVAVAVVEAPGDPGRAIVKFARGSEAQRMVHVPGSVLGLAVENDGGAAYVVVRATDRKGLLRSVELTRIDLTTARASFGASLPATARGVAFGAGGASLLVAAKDEIRTFQWPQLSSGPLYRVLGDNVGVAPVANSKRVVVAQAGRLAVADLAAAQGRDGLPLSNETVLTSPLRTMLASVGESGPIIVAVDGQNLCVQMDSLPAGGAPAALPAATPPPEEPSPSEPAPPIPPTTVVAVAAPSAAAPAAAAPVAPPPEPDPATQKKPAAPGTISGQIDGPASGEVAAIVALGPDNVLKEAARIALDAGGRFTFAGLPVGAYRVVAVGRGGRVLICDPAFLTIRVISSSAVEAPVLKVLRAP